MAAQAPIEAAAEASAQEKNVTHFLDRIRKPAGVAPERANPEPVVAPPVELNRPAPKAEKPPLVSGEPQDLPDALGIAAHIRGMAGLAAHGLTQTPLTLGFFGGAGAGKTFAVNRLLADIRAIAVAASGRRETPYLARIVTARVDAASAADPAVAIASAIHAALHAPSPYRSAFAAWAEDAAYNSGDPQQVVRETGERVADLRRRHDAEKEALQEIRNRRARLTENVLYDSAGTRIDSYARNNRSGLENRLSAFGFTGADPVATYKDLVRDFSENGGIVRRVRVFLYSLWAYRGQARLVILAVLFCALAWLMAQGETPQAPWLTNTLANLQDRFAAFKSAADWISANAALFALLRNAALWAAAGAIAINIFRAIRFFMPIRRGVTLLHSDVDARRRELDGLIAAQSQRVDALGGEIDKNARQLAEAERRADTARSAAGSAERSPFMPSSEGLEGRARAFLRAVTSSLGRQDSANAPQRLIVAIDNLDSLPPVKAAETIQQASQILNGAGIVCAIAVDGGHLKSGLNAQSGSAAGLAGEYLSDMIARLVNLPFRLDLQPGADFGNLVKTILPKQDAEPPAAVAAPDASFSGLDEPVQPAEAELLAALSPLAGQTPRAVKRFVDTYRLVRHQAGSFASLAVALAVDSGGTDAEKRELQNLLTGSDDAPVPVPQDNSRLAMAIRAASAAQASPIPTGSLRQAQALAAMYSGRF